jgi:uncharacterized membrane protein YhaH (DUF805 family)
MNWYLKVLKQYADFEGRARRMEYWMFALINVIIALLLYSILFVGIFTESTFLSSIGGILYLVYILAVFLPGLGVSVRRLHDTNKSGWMILIALIPIIGAIWLIILYATEGDKGDNPYGPDPKA